VLRECRHARSHEPCPDFERCHYYHANVDCPLWFRDGSCAARQAGRCTLTHRRVMAWPYPGPDGPVLSTDDLRQRVQLPRSYDGSPDGDVAAPRPPQQRASPTPTSADSRRRSPGSRSDLESHDDARLPPRRLRLEDDIDSQDGLRWNRGSSQEAHASNQRRSLDERLGPAPGPLPPARVEARHMDAQLGSLDRHARGDLRSPQGRLVPPALPGRADTQRRPSGAPSAESTGLPPDDLRLLISSDMTHAAVALLGASPTATKATKPSATDQAAAPAQTVPALAPTRAASQPDAGTSTSLSTITSATTSRPAEAWAVNDDVAKLGPPPPPWTMVLSRTQNRFYYYNPETDETSWTHPALLHPQPTPAAPVAPAPASHTPAPMAAASAPAPAASAAPVPAPAAPASTASVDAAGASLGEPSARQRTRRLLWELAPWLDPATFTAAGVDRSVLRRLREAATAPDSTETLNWTDRLCAPMAWLPADDTAPVAQQAVLEHAVAARLRAVAVAARGRITPTLLWQLDYLRALGASAATGEPVVDAGPPALAAPMQWMPPAAPTPGDADAERRTIFAQALPLAPRPATD